MSTYVYGITHDSGSLDAAKLTGVGEPPSEVRFVRADGLAAAVSTTPEGLRAKRRDLAAHQEVLVELAREAAVLPMRFGAVAPDDEAVAAELRRSRDHYTALLDRLRDRVEVNVKATHIEEAALRAVLTENEELRRANERLREAGGGPPPTAWPSASRWPRRWRTCAGATPTRWWSPSPSTPTRSRWARRSTTASPTSRSWSTATRSRS